MQAVMAGQPSCKCLEFLLILSVLIWEVLWEDQVEQTWQLLGGRPNKK